MGLGFFHPLDLRVDGCWEAPYVNGPGVTQPGTGSSTITDWVDFTGSNSFNTTSGAGNALSYTVNNMNGKNNVVVAEASEQGLITTSANSSYYGSMTWYFVGSNTNTTLTQCNIAGKGGANGWGIANNTTSLSFVVNNGYTSGTTGAITQNAACVQYFGFTVGSNITASVNNVVSLNTTIGTPASASGQLAVANRFNAAYFNGNYLGLYWFKRLIAAWEKSLMDEYCFVQVALST